MELKQHKIEFFVTIDDLLELNAGKEDNSVKKILDAVKELQAVRSEEENFSRRSTSYRYDSSKYQAVLENTPNGVKVIITYQEVKPKPKPVPKDDITAA